MTELYADLWVGEQQQLGVRQSDPSSPSDGEAWLRDDQTDSTNDKIGELRWYVGSATNIIPIFAAGTSGQGVTEELRVEINSQTGFVPVTRDGAFPEHRIQSGGETRTLTDSKALDVVFDILTLSTNSPVTAGENLVATYDVENTGSDSGSDSIDLLNFADETVATQVTTLNSGEQLTGQELIWATQEGDAGSGDVTVKSSATQLSASVTIEEAPAIPDSGLNHELYRWNAQFALNSGISAGTQSFAWPESNGLLSDASAVAGPTLRSDQAGLAASEYDGVDDGHDWTADNNLPTGDAAHSWAATINLKSVDRAHAIASYGPDNNGEVSYLRIDDTNAVGLSKRNTQALGNTSLSVDSWVTVGASYDPDTGEATVYLNGSQDGSDGGFGPLNLGDADHRLGHKPVTFGEYADAFIYDVILSNGVESSSAFGDYHTNMVDSL
jgi:hypothetical protein